MNTIFWLAVVFCIISLLMIVWQVIDYIKSSVIEQLYYNPRLWMYPTFIVSLIVALTVRG